MWSVWAPASATVVDVLDLVRLTMSEWLHVTEVTFRKWPTIMPGQTDGLCSKQHSFPTSSFTLSPQSHEPTTP